MPLDHRSGTPVTIKPTATLAHAAKLMVQSQVGALLIRKDPTSPIEGILTDRDIVKEVAEGRDVAATTAARYVGRPVETVSVSATRGEIAKKMRTHGVRRIPFVDDSGDLAGVVTMDDLIFEMGTELFDLSRAVETGLTHEMPWPDSDE